MCGLFAYVGAPIERARVVAINNSVAYRGPDGEGYLALTEPVGSAIAAEPFLAAAPRTGAVLAHRRLAIQDLTEAGAQPATSPCGRYALVFNGEIYNHWDLRPELQRRGWTFRSRSDTETLLAAWSIWGGDGLHRLHGMFAFVIADLQERRLHAVRDRFGIKPLFLLRLSGAVAFASQLKQLLQVGPAAREPEPDAIGDWIAHGLIAHSPQTIWRRIQQVSPGAHITVALDDTAAPPSCRTWYRPPEGAFSGSFDEAASALEGALTESVGQRFLSDVPVGLSLSGGLDSTAIAAVAARIHAPGLRSFTCAAAQSAVDETELAAQTAASLGFASFIARVDPSTVEQEARAFIREAGLPCPGPSFLMERALYREARARGVTVVLAGHGADELLCGYRDFYGPRFALDFAQRGQWRQSVAAVWRHHREASQHARRELQLRLRPPERELPRMLEPPIRRDGLEVARERQRELWQTSLPHQLLFCDLSAMLASVEARVPFLDHRLVELVLSLPLDFLMRAGATKPTLRRLLHNAGFVALSQQHRKIGFAFGQAVGVPTGAHWRGWSAALCLELHG